MIGAFRIIVEAGDCLFATSGLLTADANVEAAVTIVTPLGSGLDIEIWSLPTEILIDWTGGCIANPFTVTDPNLAEFDPNVPGLLWLNVAPRAVNRNYSGCESGAVRGEMRVSRRRSGTDPSGANERSPGAGPQANRPDSAGAGSSARLRPRSHD